MLAVLAAPIQNGVKYGALIDLVCLPKDAYKCPHLLVKVKAYRINKGVIINGERGSIHNDMLTDDNLLVRIWEQIKPVLSYSI